MRGCVDVVLHLCAAVCAGLCLCGFVRVRVCVCLFLVWLSFIALFFVCLCCGVNPGHLGVLGLKESQKESQHVAPPNLKHARTT